MADNTKKHLESVRKKGLCPASQTKKLVEAGLIETVPGAGQRGYAGARLTAAGKSALAE